MRSQIDKVLGHALWIIMSIMVINVLWQVFSRFVLNSPSSFTDELARYLMIWLSLLGAAFVSGKNKHIGLDIIPSRSSPATRKKLKKLVEIIVILLF